MRTGNFSVQDTINNDDGSRLPKLYGFFCTRLIYEKTGELHFANKKVKIDVKHKKTNKFKTPLSTAID